VIRDDSGEDPCEEEEPGEGEEKENGGDV